MRRFFQLTSPATVVPVWDLFVRIFHWSLVASITIAAVTGFLGSAETTPVHVYAATTATVLIGLRIFWGFLGGRYARFSSFLYSPKTIIEHAMSLFTGREKRYLGHNPLGGLMIFALILTIAALGLTGAVVLGGELKLGPLAFTTDFSTGQTTRDLHQAVAIFLLLLVAGHLAGVIFETRHAKDPLVPAMVTGKKPRREGDVSAPARPARTWVMVVLSAAVFTASFMLVTSYSARPAQNMPVAQINPLVAAECTACHILYHPALMPAKSWDNLVVTLDDHFGEDASLDEQSTDEIRNWLMANAAETADTRPAAIFKRELADGSFSLTETRFWKRQHGDFTDATFSDPKIRSKSNCAACHLDAETGLLSPFRINEP